MKPTSFLPFFLASLISAHGWRKKSLSPSGALAAFIVGFLTLSGDLRAFGVTLIAFYLIGSRATKYGKEAKARLEDGHHEAGYRGAWQVLSNSATAVAAAFVWKALFVPSSPHAAISNLLGLDIRGFLRLNASDVPTYTASGPDGWCPVDISIANGWSRFLVATIVGHFACCLGDTLASELGILSRSPPRLVTTFAVVPPGTNGAMSVVGTLASVAGGGIVGAVMAVSLAVENASCGGGALLGVVGWGLLGGGIGSLLDSLLGATVQRTYYSERKKMIVSEESADSRAIVGMNMLSNNQVNVVSSGVVGILGGWILSAN